MPKTKVPSGSTQARPDDRFFDEWRTAIGSGAVTLIENAVAMLLAHEAKRGLRKRGRKAADAVRFKQAVDGILSDMITVLRNPKEMRGTAIPLSKQVLGKASRYKPKWMTETVPYVLGLLAETKFIRLEKGYEGGPGYPGQRTLIWPGPRLRDDANRLQVTLDQIGKNNRDREVIVLKALKDGRGAKDKYQEYDDNHRFCDIRKLREEMVLINGWLAEADIEIAVSGPSFDRHNDKDRWMRRVFTQGEFGKGGRLFGGFWQNMKKTDRFDFLIINDESVAEVDFRQIGPRILYSLARAGARTDPSSPLPDDLYAVPGIDPKYRAGIKVLFNAMLFAEEPLKRKPQGTDKLLPSNMKIGELCSLIEAGHPELKGLFCWGLGHTIQGHESNLLVSVLLKLRERGLVGLPIHDAIITPWSMAKQVKEVMETTANERFTTSITVTIEGDDHHYGGNDNNHSDDDEGSEE